MTLAAAVILIVGIFIGGVGMNMIRGYHDCQVEIDSTLVESVNRHVAVKSIATFWRGGELDSPTAMAGIHNLYFPNSDAKGIMEQRRLNASTQPQEGKGTK